MAVPEFETIEELLEWFDADPEPVPFQSFDMTEKSGRKEFLRELYLRGKPALFEAVSYAWEVLGEPRSWRAGTIAAAAGLSGNGKCALYAAFDKFIDDALATDSGLPPSRTSAAWTNGTTPCFARPMRMSSR